MLPYQSRSRVVDSTGGKSPTCFSRTSSCPCAPENDHEFVSLQHDIAGARSRAPPGRRDRELDLCTKPGADLDVIRAALLRTIRTQTRGVSDPARRACAGADAREAGSLTPLSASLPVFCGRPGRHKAPADRDVDCGASISSCEASQRRLLHGDDRPWTAVVTAPMVERADGQLTIVPPPRPLSLLDR